jgi:Flp pilus assembly protein TadG
MRVHGGEGRERGAAAVEMALVAPLLFLLIFGIVEFGYGWSQQLNVRHGAREAGRLAAVNHRSGPDVEGDAQTAELVATSCTRLDVAEGTRISFALPDGAEAGDVVEVTVESDLNTLTGFFDGVLEGTVLSSTVSSRLEQDATWTEAEAAPCP